MRRMAVSFVVGVGLVAFVIWAFFGQFPSDADLEEKVEVYMSTVSDTYLKKLEAGGEAIAMGRLGQETPREDQLVKYIEKEYTLYKKKTVKVVCWGSGERLAAGTQSGGCWMELGDGEACHDGAEKCLKQAEKTR